MRGEKENNRVREFEDGRTRTIFENGTEVTEALLKERGVVSKTLDGVKILGNGELTKSLTVKVSRFSKSAQEKIEAAGGKVEVI